jgi:hypothetical protein
MPTPSKKQPTTTATATTTVPLVSPETSISTDLQSKKKKPVTSSSTGTVPSAVAVNISQVPHVLNVVPVVPVVSHEVVSEVIAPLPVVETAPDNVLSNIIDKVNSLSAYIKDIQANLKVLSKEYDKQQKIIEKAQKKRQNAKNSPSGFAKPNKISDELCDFIGVPHGTEKSRTDITRLINAYVKEHNLNKPENKRFILPDTKLKKILNVGDSEEINYFILQKLISHHFPVSASKIAAKAAL